MVSPSAAGVASPEVAQSPAYDATSTTSKMDTGPAEVVEEDLPSDADEETRLKFLTTGARDQDDVERDIGRQADQMLTEQADERDKKRMEKVDAEIKRNQAAIQKIRNRLTITVLGIQQAKLRGEIETYRKKNDELEEELDAIQERINKRHQAPEYEDVTQSGVNGPLPNETRRDFLIRTGKITPFMKLANTRLAADTLDEAMQDAEVEQIANDTSKHGATNHQNLMKPGFAHAKSAPRAKRKRSDDGDVDFEPKHSRLKRTTQADAEVVSPGEASATPEMPSSESDDAFAPDLNDRQLAALGETDESDNFTLDAEDNGRKRKATSRKTKAKPATKSTSATDEDDDILALDDGNEKVYRDRLRKWTQRRSAARSQAKENRGESVEEDGTDEECHKAHPTEPDGEFEGGFRVPGDIYPALFDYQQTGVEWLWELYRQNVGGILGDEMGLGKTIQTIAFIAGLHYSKKLTKPVLIVCPATVMKQWVKEFHTWWPAMRVSILHNTGSGLVASTRADRRERDDELRAYGNNDMSLSQAGKAVKKVIEKVRRDGHVLVTTYAGVETYSEFLAPIDWESVILDEGHKIRNPDTGVTINCKQLRSANRIILSGTPIQNNLSELWSLFDFVFPLRLGTLISFRNQFETPIRLGSYMNATNLAYQTAMQCAETLKDAVSPYLLQRFKADVASDLPDKKEQVLFCKLTRQQRTEYERFLQSEEMKAIQDGKRQPLYGIDYLRKICNHPDLVDHRMYSNHPNYGAPNKSGKMQVVKELVSLWTKGGHKTLIFAQNRITIDILEKRLIGKMEGISYRRMDGVTQIKDRQNLVDEFNNDPNIHVFLLTTKVGGLGVNLTGANRVIIFDPDWNPSTDIQARERSWRLGQKKKVEIYRLMSAGTIEEKIYHRQIFKQFLTNKVLKDPQQRQTFHMSDLHDLFSLGSEQADGETETGTIFRNSHAQAVQPAGPDATSASELAAVRGIDHTESYTAAADDAGKNTQDASGAIIQDRSDGALMSGIFAKSGVHSVLEHDRIMNSTSNGKRKFGAVDPAIIQREAKRQADIAGDHLRKSLKEAQQAPMGVPTWTGLNGDLGRPPTPPSRYRSRGGMRGGRGGGAPSSSNILNNLSARQGGRGGGANTPSTGNSTPAPPPTFRERTMINLIRQYIINQGGTVPSKMLVDHFDRYCRAGGPARTEVFKEMLKTVAVMETSRGGSSAGQGRGIWKLKDEWKDKAA